MTKNGDGRMTNREFAEHDREFRAACERAGIKPSVRQASKWRLGFGLAYNHRNISARIDSDSEIRLVS